MSKKQIKLLAPVFHNDRELVADDCLSIPDEITAAEANRLIKLGVAKHEIVKVFYATPPAPPAPPEPPEPPAPPETPELQKSIDEMTKQDCQNELTAAGVLFNKTAKLDELKNLVSEHRNLSHIDGDHVDINSLNREEMENELIARAIPFSANQSDDELRQLLLDDESTADE